jgi:hypothetical protein
MQIVGAAWMGSWLVFASCLGLTVNPKSSLEIKIHIGALKYLLSTFYVPDIFLQVGSTVVNKMEALPQVTSTQYIQIPRSDRWDYLRGIREPQSQVCPKKEMKVFTLV